MLKGKEEGTMSVKDRNTKKKKTNERRRKGEREETGFLKSNSYAVQLVHYLRRGSYVTR